MERAMAFWNIPTDFAPPLGLNISTGKLRYACVAGMGAVAALAVWSLFPPSLFFPALSIASFLIACGSPLFAHHFHVDHRGASLTAWNAAAMFTLMWIGVAIVSGRKPIIALFAHLPMPS
jgi:hypothetical protein